MFRFCLGFLTVFSGTVNSFQCEDDIYRDCKRRASNGECEGKGQRDRHAGTNWMLAQCRRSCWKQFSDSPLPKIIQTYGGLEDHIVDVFGFKMPICPENGGFAIDRRINILGLMALNEHQPAWVPKLTEVGFEKTKIPSDVYKMLLTEYDRVKPSMTVEECGMTGINCEHIIDDDNECSLRTSKRTYIMEISDTVLTQLIKKLHPLAEAWANIKLKYEETYGIRRYTNGSSLTSHVDRFNTHVISAIINIGQSVEEDWPLYIVDNNGQNHKVTIQAGEMIWYESARAIHGRPEPFKGEFFDNLFIHYSPLGDWYTCPYKIGKKPRQNPITIEDIRKRQ